MQPWEKQPEEPARWYARFDIFRRLGPGRTLEAAYRIAAKAEGLSKKRAGEEWHVHARRWQWRERAEAWDAVQGEVLQAQEQERRLEGREARLHMIDELLAAVFRVLVLANLPNLQEVEARQWLPTMRLLFKDLVLLQRSELGLPAGVDGAPGGAPCCAAAPPLGTQKAESIPPFTADELAAAQQELLERGEWGPESTPSQSPQSPKKLLALTGPDPALSIDIAALRTAKADAGLDFQRLEHATRDDLDAYLRRERSHGRPVRYVHIASHAGSAGIQFADGLADGAWLSAMLQGVQVLVLAGCKSDRIGDWLSVVPHVVSLADKISHQDAAILTQHFWSGIARGLKPDEALDGALARCSPVVSEFVVRHW
jgi:hypothetical protein